MIILLAEIGNYGVSDGEIGLPKLIIMYWFLGQLAAKKTFSFLHSQDLELFVGVVIEAPETWFVWEASRETS